MDWKLYRRESELLDALERKEEAIFSALETVRHQRKLQEEKVHGMWDKLLERAESGR
jgi:hypothetical protein